jgi:hypothetical protein
MWLVERAKITLFKDDLLNELQHDKCRLNKSYRIT